jgi:hypothetical protein
LLVLKVEDLVVMVRKQMQPSELFQPLRYTSMLVVKALLVTEQQVVITVVEPQAQVTTMKGLVVGQQISEPAQPLPIVLLLPVAVVEPVVGLVELVVQRHQQQVTLVAMVKVLVVEEEPQLLVVSVEPLTVL